MWNKVLLFVKYNNAFTIIIGICFFSAGITFAASPAVREGVYSSEETVTSIDNQLILQADLDNFNFNLKIDSITDDQKNYYVNYSYKTMTLVDSVWQDQKIEKVLTVNKEALGGKDLGLYVGKELADNVNYELSYLKRVQILEKEKGESKKIVTIEYSGLIGKFLDPKEKVIEGYDPVIPVPIPSIAAVEEADPQPAAVIVPLIEPKDNPKPKEEKPITKPTPPESSPENPSTTTPEVIPEATPEQTVTPTEEATTTPEIIPPTPEVPVVPAIPPTPETPKEPEVPVAPPAPEAPQPEQPTTSTEPPPPPEPEPAS